MNYNLLDEQWIPVLYRNGTWTRVGIRKALADAGRIRQIAASNPMDRLAILRFLLAVLYWCKGNPPASTRADPDTSFPSDWFSKLDADVDRFNLLGDGTRFYQDHTARRLRPVTDLLQEIPTGNNFWHFRHSIDGKEGLCCACSAMGLLRLPLFCVSGLPDLKAGINGTPPLYAVLSGRTLLETLRANWVPYANLGEPAWMRPNIHPSPAQKVPLLTGLTLLARRVWLHDAKGPGTCVACGAKETTLIWTCEFQSAGDQKNDLWSDPHVVYSDATPGRAARAADLTKPGKFRMDRPWADVLVRILETGRFCSEDSPAALLIVGFATDKAKNIDVWERTFRVQSARSIHEGSTARVAQWEEQGRKLIPRLVRVVKSPNEKRGSRKHIEIPPLLTAIRPHVEDRISAKVGELIAGDNDAWDRAAEEYRPMMDGIARPLSPGVTTAAVQRRKQIARVVPDMRLKGESPKKPRRGKGGDK